MQHAQKQPQLPPQRQPPCLPLHQRILGQPGRQRYVREGPPPLVDAKGQVRLIVNYIVGHEDSNREATSTAQETRTDLSARKYRILWHEFRSN